MRSELGHSGALAPEDDWAVGEEKDALSWPIACSVPRTPCWKTRWPTSRALPAK
ncbi:MAG: hypothetical protein ACLSVD_13230 [Eggerthellaceae bacterium]